MMTPEHKIALFMEGALRDFSAKMGVGVLRYSPNAVVCVIDSAHAGQDAGAIVGVPRSVPVVASVEEATALGADVFLLGIAPGGGLIPASWYGWIDRAVELGMNVVNGLHDRLQHRYPGLQPGQWIWDIRIEPTGIGTATGKAAQLSNRRALFVGTDMSVGKMTAGLEIHRVAKERGVRSAFVATGQIGITITGAGVPLDAVRVDYAPGSIEAEVLKYADAELILVEGQGALCHPSSSAPLSLIRGSCPTHLIMCARAGQTTLARYSDFRIPALRPYIRLYEDVVEACGTFARPKTVGIALNTHHLGPDEARAAAAEIEDDTGLPTVDPVRDGAGRLVDALLS